MVQDARSVTASYSAGRRLQRTSMPPAVSRHHLNFLPPCSVVPCSWDDVIAQSSCKVAEPKVCCHMGTQSDSRGCLLMLKRSRDCSTACIYSARVACRAAG